MREIDIDKEDLIELRNKGLTYEEIAEELEVSDSTVYRRFRDMDIGSRHTVKSSNIREMSELDRAYIAGIVDGEGSIGLYEQTQKRKDYEKTSLRPTVQIAMTDKETVGYVGRTAGSGSKSYKYTKSDNWKEQEKFAIQAQNDIIDFLEQIRPYLITKKDQAELMLEYCRNRDPHKPYSEREYEIKEKLSELNSRGPEKDDE